MMRLKGKIQPVAMLSEADKERMFFLMTSYYENVKHKKFLHDLAEKEGVLALYDDTNEIQGFTTFMMIETSFQGEMIYALFSGDTIVDRRFWGQLELFRVFGRLFKKFLLEKREPLYWFLLTKGIKTYGLLPLFFKRFYPNYASATPEYEHALISHLASEKFGRFYLEDQGIVRIIPKANRLKENLAYIPANKYNKPYMKFFTKQNPGYVEGDELVCLARISPLNFTHRAQRFVKL